MAIKGQWCGSNPEDFLLGYPGYEEVWDLVEKLNHDIWVARDAWFEEGVYVLGKLGSMGCRDGHMFKINSMRIQMWLEKLYRDL